MLGPRPPRLIWLAYTRPDVTPARCRLRVEGAEVRVRRAPRRGGIRTCVPAPLPRYGGRNPRALLDDARRDRRFRGNRQVARLRAAGPPSGLVALLPAAGAVAAVPRRRDRQRARGWG